MKKDTCFISLGHLPPHLPFPGYRGQAWKRGPQHMLSGFSRVLVGDMDCSPPGSSVRGILQARILERVAMPSCQGTSRPRDHTQVSYVSCTGIGFFTTSATWPTGGPHRAGLAMPCTNLCGYLTSWDSRSSWLGF